MLAQIFVIKNFNIFNDKNLELTQQRALLLLNNRSRIHRA